MSPERTKEAVCFTSGPAGAAFGAGVIHAWLAADREPPAVVAGISAGAVTAAAMRKCHREAAAGIAGADVIARERARWTWFRKYLDTVTHDPLDFVWRSIPNPVDFFADKAPVKDLSVRLLPQIERDEPEARRHFHLLTKLGVWLAGLPVRVSTLASVAVFRVRFKEGYGRKSVNLLGLAFNVIKIAGGVWLHLACAPGFFSEKHFDGKGMRPLFGWRLWLGSVSPAPLAAICCWLIFSSHRTATLLGGALAAAALAGLFLLFAIRWARPKYLFGQLGMAQAALSNFELRRRLWALFGDELVGHDTLIVCAALEQTEQVWLAPDIKMVDALTAATAIPGIFPPSRMNSRQVENCAGGSDVTLIDGVAVRNNPIPAFFAWCKKTPAAALEIERTEPVPSLHVVYSVPIGITGNTKPRESIDIVESALAAQALAKRRDTRQEVRQTNFCSLMEGVRRSAAGGRDAFQIFAGEIAPPVPIEFQNSWEPGRAESLIVAAQGCRETLETLYRDRIPPEGMVCAALLRHVAPGRQTVIDKGTCGVPEICGSCSGRLSRKPPPLFEQQPPGLLRSYGAPGNPPAPRLETRFHHLNGDHPRIVFLGNGGVFRGAFHIGVIGAMSAAHVYPDLVIGASVGALMGGALANISLSSHSGGLATLHNLASVFLAVDERVALTRTLKNASKQLGVRARDLAVSPSELRDMVKRGSQSDPGFAATGAPPALIDALSTLFMIPHRCTAEIASQFVAGHITQAVKGFLTEVRKETLQSLDITNALLGISLLESVARELLGEKNPGVDLTNVQPWHGAQRGAGERDVSFFCTTSFLNERMPLLLGRDFLTEDPTWDGVFAALSSSAFPAVFSPRSEAEVLPGRGHTDRLFADGGMFDNLPFLPAIEVLLEVQASGRDKSPPEVFERLKKRTEAPDLFIAAGLDAPPDACPGTYDTLGQIRKRAKTLSVENKVRSFADSSAYVQRALSCIVDHGPGGVTPENAEFLDQAVNAHVLQILPTDPDHVNPTFAFCRSTGFDKNRVRRSIADGCFRSLVQFRHAARDARLKPVLSQSGVPELEVAYDERSQAPDCPYFKLADKRLACPFAQREISQGDLVTEIRNVCAKDEAHRNQIRALKPN